MASWSGPKGSSLCLYTTIAAPRASAASLAKEIAGRYENLPGLKVVSSGTIRVGSRDAARIDALAPGSGDALAATGLGRPKLADGRPMVPTRRILIGLPQTNRVAWVLWHVPESELGIVDEIEKVLALDTAPITWPIGRGRAFAGTYDLAQSMIRKLDSDVEAPMLPVDGPRDPQIRALLPSHEADAAIDELELAREACKPFDREAFLEGHLTPVFFGSALRTFGVADLINALANFAPPPRGLQAESRYVDAREAKMTGFVFKIQANMDPNHRDRIAFMRVSSGRLTRGMKAKLVRTGKPMALNAPQFFFAQERALAEQAFAGDVVGIPNHGTLRIGDTLTEGEDLVFRGVPSFAPEILRRVKLNDAMKAKKLKEALQQMAEEGGGADLRALRRCGRHRWRGRRPAARRSDRTVAGRVQPAGLLRIEPLRDRPMGDGGAAGVAKVPRCLSVVDGGGSRRLAGVPGLLRLHAALRAGALAAGDFLRHQGLSARRSLIGSVRGGGRGSAVAEMDKPKSSLCSPGSKSCNPHLILRGWKDLQWQDHVAASLHRGAIDPGLRDEIQRRTETAVSDEAAASRAS